MTWEKNPDRVRINQHLHRMHQGFAASGDTLARNVMHDELHNDGVDGWAGKPEHRHIDYDIENIETREPE